MSKNIQGCRGDSFLDLCPYPCPNGKFELEPVLLLFTSFSFGGGDSYSATMLLYISHMSDFWVCPSPSRSVPLPLIHFIQHDTFQLYHVSTNCMTLSFLMSDQYSILDMNHSFIIQSSTYRHLRCVRILPSVNSSVMNICV